MIYGSLCSGIEAATQAWHPIGWTPAFFSEIERFPSAVLAHHYPDVPNHGDMTRFQEWPDHAIDLLVGGTPCQDYSVAGLRLGMAGARGQLTLTFVEIAARYRPRWLVWENVPGVFSSNDGRDFARFLGDLSGQVVDVPAGGWQNSGIVSGDPNAYGIAWVVRDAQYVRTCRHAGAVPQRRRRVFVVGYLGDWRRAAAVLFDGESLSGNPPPRREAPERVAPTISARPTGGGGLGTDFDLDGGLICANSGEVGYCLTASAQQSLDAETETLVAVAHALRGDGFDASEDGTGRGTPIVPVAIQERAICENPNAGPDGIGCRQDGAAYTLEARTVPQAVAYRTAGDGAVYEEGGATAPLTTATDPNAQVVAFSVKDHGGDAMEGVCPTLRAGGFDRSHANGGVMPAVAFDLRGREGGAMPEGPHDTANIRAADGGSSRSYVATEWAVRRLTPEECEALQAFPRNFTRIPYRGKPADQCPDGPRYKALGNSMAVNVMTLLGERIGLVDAIQARAA